MLPPRAYIFISLNAARALSILALLLVFASSIVTLVEDVKAVHKGDTASVTTTDASGNTETFECDYFEGSTVPNQPAGVFWAIINRLFIIAMTVLLILSELGWPNRFFTNFMPVLGNDFGVGILGAIQWILAASILSHHVDEFALVSAWFLFALGCINILLGLIFRANIKVDRSISTFRETKAKEFLPGPVQHAVPNFKILETSVGSVFDEKVRKDNTGGSGGNNSFGSGYGFGRQGEKLASLKGYMISRPVETLPRYAPRPATDRVRDDDEETTSSRSRSPSPKRPNRI